MTDGFTLIMAMNKLMLIHASEVAACIGRNPYKSRGDMIPIVLKRYSAAAFQRLEMCTQDDLDASIITKARHSDPVIDAAVAASELAGTMKTSFEVHEIVERATAACVSACECAGSTATGVLTRHCRGEAFRRFGTAQESDSLRGLELTDLVKDDKYTKRRIQGELTMCVGGRVDGFAKQAPGKETVLVEIKNRMNRLFNRVVDYERIQVLTYMFIFNRDCAKLVERKGDDAMVHDIVFIPEEWEEISQRLQEFGRDVMVLMSS